MTGYQTDMKMYKAPDYRCLKPKEGLPSSEWPHYDMKQHRAARTSEELEKVEEIPFDKEFDNISPFNTLRQCDYGHR